MTAIGIMASAVIATADVLLEPFNNFTAAPWSVAGTAPAPAIVTGRTGTAAQLADASASVTFIVPAAAESDLMMVGLAWRTSTIATQPQVLGFRSDSGGTDHIRLRITSGGALQVRRTSSTLGTSATGLIVADTWYYIEIQSRLHDTAGSAVVRLNGTERLNLTGIDTKNLGTKTVYDTLRLETGVNPATTLSDDLYVSMGASATFKGDITIP